MLAPLIALMAVWIAYRQSQIARNKLKLDLFEKRMVVYQAVREALSTVAQRGNLTQEEQINYLVGTRSARWLFNSKIYEYLDKSLWHKIVDLELHNSMMSGPMNDQERVSHIRSRADTILWLGAQYEAFDRLCAEDLSLKH